VNAKGAADMARLEAEANAAD